MMLGRPIRNHREEIREFEEEIYPFWKDKAIMEIELSSEEQQVRFPPEIKVIREVTDDPSFKNIALAKTAMRG